MADIGSHKIVHCTLMNAEEVPFTGTGKSKNVIEVEYKYFDDFNQKNALDTAKFFDGFYGLPQNAKLKEALMALVNGEAKEFTILKEKGEKYWDNKEITIGHNGTAGLQGGTGGGSGTQPASNAGQAPARYDASGAKAGMLVNNAVLILTTSGEEVTEKALMEKAAFINGVAERVRLEIVGAEAPAAKEAPAAAKKTASKADSKLKEGDDSFD